MLKSPEPKKVLLYLQNVFMFDCMYVGGQLKHPNH